MKIAFDARMVDHPGIGRYIRNLLSAILFSEKDAQFTLFGVPENLKGLGGSAIEQYQAPIYSWQELFRSPLTASAFDVTHIPHFNAPFEKMDNLVVTVHDFIYLKFPRFATFLKSTLVRPVIANTIKNAKRIIVVSENTRKDVIENFPSVKKKIRVIYEAADPVFRRISDTGLKESIRAKYNLPQDFILYVGSLRKHKNIEGLIEAYLSLKSGGMRHGLVVVGRPDPEEAGIMKKVSSVALYLGEIPTQDLAVIYNLASLFILPSLYEGFGLPVLEAMACGAPVVASNVASLPEVVGSAGLLFNPRDKKELADKMRTLLTDTALRNELVSRGSQRVKEFSWEAAARATWEVYKEVAKA